MSYIVSVHYNTSAHKVQIQMSTLEGVIEMFNPKISQQNTAVEFIWNSPQADARGKLVHQKGFDGLMLFE